MQAQNPSTGRILNGVIVDYDFGNVRSVANALEVLGATASLSRNPEVLRQADYLILPGVGAFADGMAHLQKFNLITLLEELVLERKKPFLGICVGMQLLAKTGFENGKHQGLGWIDADVVRFDAKRLNGLKVPHVGWNDVVTTQNDPILGESGETHSYYFVHSYHLECRELNIVIGKCDYGYSFPAVIRKDNISAVQFHPEKSQKHGLKLLQNFLDQTSQETRQGEAATC